MREKTIIEDFMSAPWPIKIFLLCALVYLFVVAPLIATGYFGEGIQRGFLMALGVRN